MANSETLTSHFYEWEVRGRGWRTYGFPVQVEPPFEPFFHALPTYDKEDDGLRPMPIVTLLNKLGSLISPSAERPQSAAPASLAPKRYADAPRVTFTVSLPRSLDLVGYEAEQLLLMLSYCAHSVSFEVVGTHNRMGIHIACCESEAEYVLNQFRVLYPTCAIQPSQDILASIGEMRQDTIVADFGLCEEFMRPLLSAESDKPSMYLALKGVFDALRAGEHACLQILFQGTARPWAVSVIRSVTDGEGSSFFADAPDMPKLAQRKVASQLFGVVVRILVSTPSEGRTDEVLSRAAHAVVAQTKSPWNALIPLSNDGYDPDLHREDFLMRRSRRSGMLLNTEELAAMAHVPQDDMVVAALSGGRAKTKAAPTDVQGHVHVLGTNTHVGTQKEVSVSASQRMTHCHVIGATGTGKSTFLLNSVSQDIQDGNGLALIDPHGDLVEAVLNLIPEHRLKDVVIVDPSDPEYSVGFNILKANTVLEKEVLSSDLVSVFQKFSTSWGDQMTSVLANTLLAFLESSEGGTLLDVRRFLLEQAYRKSVLKTVSDGSILYYWEHEFPVIKTNSIGSILTRLDSFLRPKAIRHMVAQKEGLNFTDIVSNQKILLIKLSHGLIGETNSHLLGSLFLSKIYQTALGRQSKNISDRRGFFVYVDEFQHYVTPSMSHLLSGGRKYGLGLTLAHQSLEQIFSTDRELAESLLANAGIRICFRLGESDAQKLERGFASFDADDLINLGTGQAICRVGRSDMDFNISVPKDVVTSSKDFIPPASVIEASRKKNGVLRSTLDPIVEPQAQVEVAKTPKETRVVAQPVETVPPKKVMQETPTASEVKVIEDPELIQSIVRRREESRHKYLQMLIKRNAESRGYKATLEQATKDGKGRVDVVLQRDNLAYAIEVGVTTTKDWEVHNIEKCLADGFVNIIALSEDMKGADLMTRKLNLAGILPREDAKVKVYDLTGFMGVLNAETAHVNSKVKTIKGYRVKVEYGGVS